MNAQAFRYLYDYHFSENSKVWVYITQLSPEQFTQNVDYSHGSVRDQVIHLMNVDEIWFSELRNVELIQSYKAAAVDDRESIRAYWDGIERDMRDYLANLRDEELDDKPIQFEEDKDLIVWQVLLHVVNHGTDHRAQLLRTIHDFGIKTSSQDFVFYIYDHLL
jgi:uncharacterized damage-inducible protein DinB